MDSVESRQADC